LWALRTEGNRFTLRAGLYDNSTLALDEEDMDFLVEVRINTYGTVNVDTGTALNEF